jgi:hypothetical protein
VAFVESEGHYLDKSDDHEQAAADVQFDIPSQTAAWFGEEDPRGHAKEWDCDGLQAKDGDVNPLGRRALCGRSSLLLLLFLCKE